MKEYLWINFSKSVKMFPPTNVLIWGNWEFECMNITKYRTLMGKCNIDFFLHFLYWREHYSSVQWGQNLIEYIIIYCLQKENERVVLDIHKMMIIIPLVSWSLCTHLVLICYIEIHSQEQNYVRFNTFFLLQRPLSSFCKMLLTQFSQNIHC